MAYDEKKPLSDEKHAELTALADKVMSAYDEFRKTLLAARTTSDPDWSCLDCPKTPGGPICSSFMGNANDLGAKCERQFCGHTLLWHVGG